VRAAGRLHEKTSLALAINQYIHLNPIRIKRFGTQRGGMSLGQAIEQDPQLAGRLLDELKSYGWSSYGCYAQQGYRYDWVGSDWIEQILGERTEQAARSAYARHLVEVIGANHSAWKEKIVGQIFARFLFFYTTNEEVS